MDGNAEPVNLARAERRLGWGLVAPALLWTVAFFVLPFAAMVALSFAHMEGREVVRGFDPGNYVRIFTDWTMLKALINSLEITVVVTVVSVVLAYPLAAIIAFRVPARWQRLALLLAVLPFWTSYVVRSYSWLLASLLLSTEDGCERCKCKNKSDDQVEDNVPSEGDDTETNSSLANVLDSLSNCATAVNIKSNPNQPNSNPLLDGEYCYNTDSQGNVSIDVVQTIETNDGIVQAPICTT
ncbi:MAG: ABC transporter permease, partial [Alphaproteobacteria bacterium]